MQKTSTIALTGGGTAGHVNALLALHKDLEHDGWQVIYIGSYKGIEASLIKAAGISYYPTLTGKIRRYLSWKNVLDLFKTAVGCLQCLWLFVRLKPKVLLSRGGYVSFPSSVAAWILRVPVILLEADISLGLAARLTLPITNTVFYAFDETKAALPDHIQSLHIGLPIRANIIKGNKEAGLALAGFSPTDPRPVLLFMGGSQGSLFLKQLFLTHHHELTHHYRIIFLCGSNLTTEDLENAKSHMEKNTFCYFSYIAEDIKDIYAASHLAISRAGANSIFELLACAIPSLLIPLEQGSRGEQVANATSIHNKKLALMVREHQLSQGALIQHLKTLEQLAPALKKQMRTCPSPSQSSKIIADSLRSYLSSTS